MHNAYLRLYYRECIAQALVCQTEVQLWCGEICRPCHFQTCSEISRVLRDSSHTLSICTLVTLAGYGRSTPAARRGSRSLLSCPGEERFLWDSWQQGTCAPAPVATRPAGSGLFTMKPNGKRKVSSDACSWNAWLLLRRCHLLKGKTF